MREPVPENSARGMISVWMTTIELLKLQPSQLGALLTGLLVGIGTGALAGWQVGLGVGGVVTALLLMQSLIRRPAAPRDASRNSAPTPLAPHGIEIYRVSDLFLMDRALKFLETLGALGQRPGVLILDLTGLSQIDATALRIVGQIVDRAGESGVLVLVAGRYPSATEALSRSRALPESVLFDSLDDAVQRARVHLQGKGSRPPRVS
jgi:anti-anti-sigma regulatory factor